jgi:hypothetical protein
VQWDGFMASLLKQADKIEFVIFENTRHARIFQETPLARDEVLTMGRRSSVFGSLLKEISIGEPRVVVLDRTELDRLAREYLQKH